MSKVEPGFQIAYEIKEGSYGKGIFAKEFISMGTRVWNFVPRIPGKSTPHNIISYHTEEEVRERLKEFTFKECVDFLDHCYMFNGTFNEILDDGKYWNHSSFPNTGNLPEDPVNSYALKDIQEGEELFDDYKKYQYTDWYLKLCLEYGSELDYIYTS